MRQLSRREFSGCHSRAPIEDVRGILRVGSTATLWAFVNGARRICPTCWHLWPQNESLALWGEARLVGVVLPHNDNRDGLTPGQSAQLGNLLQNVRRVQSVRLMGESPFTCSQCPKGIREGRKLDRKGWAKEQMSASHAIPAVGISPGPPMLRDSSKTVCGITPLIGRSIVQSSLSFPRKACLLPPIHFNDSNS